MMEKDTELREEQYKQAVNELDVRIDEVFKTVSETFGISRSELASIYAQHLLGGHEK